MAYNATRKVRTKDLKALAAKVKALLGDTNEIKFLSNYQGSTREVNNVGEAFTFVCEQLFELYDEITHDESDLYTQIGLSGRLPKSNLSYLTTSDKTSIVNAVNEVKSLADVAQTTANTGVTNAATAQSTANTAKTNAATANTNIGTLSNLNTFAKSNIVAAINELESRLGLIILCSSRNVVIRRKRLLLLLWRNPAPYPYTHASSQVRLQHCYWPRTCLIATFRQVAKFRIIA